MKTLSEKTKYAVDKAAKILLDGGVLAVPTETVYGLVTLWNNKEGRERIYALKHRPAEKRLQMLAANLIQACEGGARLSPSLEILSDNFWPGPLTVVIPSVHEGQTVGLRIPNHDFLQALLRRLPEPLAATSANLSGCPPASSAAEAVSGLDGRPDLLINGGSPSITGGSASTVVSLLEAKPKIIREGVITQEQIEKVLSTLPEELKHNYGNNWQVPSTPGNIVELPLQMAVDMRERRKRLGISTENLSRLLKVDSSTIRKWESHRVRKCNRAHFEAICYFLNEYERLNLQSDLFPTNEKLLNDSGFPNTTLSIIKELTRLLWLFRTMPREHKLDELVLQRLQSLREYVSERRKK